MSNECDLVKDLLPSYVDDLCSEYSKELVIRHIKQCNKCRHTLETLKSYNQLSNKELLKAKEPFALINRKNKRKIISLTAIFFVILIVLGSISLFSYNAYFKGFVAKYDQITIMNISQLTKTSFEIEVIPTEGYIIKAHEQDRMDGDVFLRFYLLKIPPFSFQEKAIRNSSQIYDFAFPEGLTELDIVNKIYIVDSWGNKDAKLIWAGN